MTQKTELGKLGEDLACRYLVDKGYEIIERNFRKPWGELDIIAKSSDKTLVFVEVKTMRQSGLASPDLAQRDNQPDNYSQLPDSNIEPEMQMTSAKIRKFKRTASLYAGNCPEFIDDRKGWRIDLLALTLQESSGSTLSKLDRLTIDKKNCVIKHYKNI